ncbi:hypothetical protein FNF31_00547 [Cafeteria roenbergensis]|uniref:Uncharacterized protein n=1 Tax=Cafeteria roenbergensis TaxID=33653 RepID=A0A5A8DRY1_CAFRO|nr:hypothetical protein FNF31_00547 [Cafeteria roenbergensis]
MDRDPAMANAARRALEPFGPERAQVFTAPYSSLGSLVSQAVGAWGGRLGAAQAAATARATGSAEPCAAPEGSAGALPACGGSAGAAAEGPVMEVRLVLMDLGVASPQLDDGTNRRGLSFRRQGPLDMRLGGDGDATGETAAELVSVLPRPMLARLFEQAGELGPQEAQRVATAITEWRSSGRRRRRIGSVLELRTVVERCVAEAVGEPKGLAVQVRRERRRTKGAPLDCATVWRSAKDQARALAATEARRPRGPGLRALQGVWQALRVAVNEERAHLRTALEAARALLRGAGGRGASLALIAFERIESAYVEALCSAEAGLAPAAAPAAESAEASDAARSLAAEAAGTWAEAVAGSLWEGGQLTTRGRVGGDAADAAGGAPPRSEPLDPVDAALAELVGGADDGDEGSDAALAAQAGREEEEEEEEASAEDAGSLSTAAPADHGGAGSHEASDDGRYDDANDDDDDEGEGEGQAGAALGAAGLPVNAGWPPASVLLTPPGGLRPGRDEVSANSRSRSARLFVAAWDSALTAVSGPERAVAWPTRSTDRGVVGATAPLRAAERARERRKEGRRLARAAARRAADEARQLEVTGRAVPDDEPAMTAKGGLATRLKLRTRADAGADMAELRTDLDGDASAAAAARGGAVLGVYGNLRIVDDSAPARGADSADGESWSDGLFEPQDGEESLGWADGDDTDGTEAETPRARATGGAAPRISLRGALADPPVFAAPARPADDRRDADDAGSFDDWNAEWQAAKDRR